MKKHSFWRMTGALMSFALGAFLSMPAHAADDDMQAPPPACQIKVGAGEAGKGFAKLLKDIQDVCGSEITVCGDPTTKGGMDNVGLLASNAVDVGMVQLDILQNMRGTDESNIGSLQGLFPLNYNLLHILTRSQGFEQRKAGEKKYGFIKGDDVVTILRITKFSELRGKTVGLVGSANLMARTLNATLGMGMNFTAYEKDAQAIADLKAGKIHAVMSVAGWPAGPIAGLKATDNIALVPYDLQPAAPYVLIKKNYPNMNVFNGTFLAVPSLIVTRPFKPTGAKGKLVNTLRSCLTKKLDDLQEGSYQPGWKDVKNVDELFGVTRFPR